ncbi:DnaB-like helicase C-terminal domain-containing protein [Streptomyces sp. SID3343]|uniref:DnaB-like helicase C-terminal domain-containing protein n=1 Tax=Streptomyces sp. SID3343 TaxID=2690260 RepID=UPI0013688BE2|nr:DnaB-like helicase C-terminal domain-containing protein [Streptomyces sp. SID3343]MYW00045.1 AAA family ATPase [Streptomyces sp. SID3343]
MTTRGETPSGEPDFPGSAEDDELDRLAASIAPWSHEPKPEYTHVTITTDGAITVDRGTWHDMYATISEGRGAAGESGVEFLSDNPLHAYWFVPFTGDTGPGARRTNDVANRMIWHLTGGPPLLAPTQGPDPDAEPEDGVVEVDPVTVEHSVLKLRGPVVFRAGAQDLTAAQLDLIERTHARAVRDLRGVTPAEGSGRPVPRRVAPPSHPESPGVRCGLVDVDSATGGLRGGQLVVVSGETATGKSALALQFARVAAVDQDIPAAVFTLESYDTELAERLLSAVSGVPRLDLYGDHRTERDRRSVEEAEQRLRRTRMLVEGGGSNLTLRRIQERARAFRRAHPDLGLIMIDYLDLLIYSSMGTADRMTEDGPVAAIAPDLKALARELHVPVLLVTQLRLAFKPFRGNVPTPRDLPGAGALEQAADMVILIHRKDPLDPDAPDIPRPNPVDLIVTKQRTGPPITTTVDFQADRMRFVDIPRN